VLQGQLDRWGRANMRGHPFAVSVSNARGGPDFGVLHDCHMRSRAGNRLVSRDVQLDGVHAFAHQHSARAGDFVHAVHHHCNRFAVDVHAPLVAQVAGAGQFGTGGQQPRTGDVPGIDVVANGHVEARLRGPAAEAGGEAGLKYDLGVVQGLQRVFLGRHVAGIGNAGLVHEGQVRVAFDQARNHRVSRNVELRIRMHVARCFRPDFGDAVTPHQDVRSKPRPSAAVPDSASLQQHAFHECSRRAATRTCRSHRSLYDD